MATASDTGNPPRPLAPRLRVGDGIPVFSLPDTSGVSVSSTLEAFGLGAAVAHQAMRAAALGGPKSLVWVMGGKPRTEHVFSGFPSITDL